MSEAVKEILYEVKGMAAWITINRAEKRNPLNMQMVDDLMTYLDDAEADDNVRVVCITGAGDKVFCSGMDIKAAFAAGDPSGGSRKYADLLIKMHTYSKPLVARVAGSCYGGGMGLMLACDVVYAREGIKIGTPEVNVGVFPMMIGAYIFRNAIRKKAMEMIFAARMFGPEEAEEMGLITRWYSNDEFEKAVDGILQTISEKAPMAIKIGRRALAEVETMPFAEAVGYLCGKLDEVIKTEDAMEGMMAFVQKRAPVWKNK